MRRFALALIIFASGTLAAQEPNEMHHMNRMSGTMQCSMNVVGAEAKVSDTADGVAITFTAQGKKVREVRQHLRQMAKMHGKASNNASEMMDDCLFATAEVQYHSVPDGGSLTLKPRNAAELPGFRQKVRQHIEQMKLGECCTGSDAPYCPMHAGVKGEN